MAKKKVIIIEGPASSARQIIGILNSFNFGSSLFGPAVEDLKAARENTLDIEHEEVKPRQLPAPKQDGHEAHGS